MFNHICNDNYSKYIKSALIIPIYVFLIAYFPPVIRLAYVNVIETNPSVEYFLWLKFALNLIVVILCTIIIFKFSKTFIQRYNSYIIFLTAFLYSSYRILKTFDITDTGFHVTKAYGMFNGSITQNIDFIVGTSFIYGLWLDIIGRPLILWARLGYLIVVSLIVLFSFKIYKLYFNKFSHSIIFFLIMFYFIHYNYYYTVNYDNLPVMFSLIGAYFLLRSNAKTGSDIFVAGLFFAVTILVKLNFVLIIFMIPVMVLYFYLRKDSEITKKSIIFISAYIVIFIAGSLILGLTGTLGTYVNYIRTGLIERSNGDQDHNEIGDYLKYFQGEKHEYVSEYEEDDFYYLPDEMRTDSVRNANKYRRSIDSHDPGHLFDLYYSDSWHTIRLTVKFLIIFGLIIYVLSVKIRSYFIKIFISLCMSFYMFYGIYSRLAISADKDHTLITAYAVCSYILFCIFNDNDSLYLPFSLSALLALFSFPGSNMSFNVILRSGAGLCLFALPIAFLYDKKVILAGKTIYTRYVSLILIAFLVLSTVKPVGYSISHRDMLDRRNLRTMFRSEQLFGIQSNYFRVMVIDEVLDFFSKEDYERNNTPALFMGWIPKMYYLTETNCITNNPWHAMISVFDKFKDEFEKAADKHKPVYITFSKVYTRYDYWPLQDENYNINDSLWYYDHRQQDYIKYKWMAERNYTKVFENLMFEVWKLDM